MSSRQSDESEKDLKGYAMPNSHEKRGRGSYLRSSAERGGSFTGTIVQRQVAERELARHRGRQNEPKNEKKPED